MTTIILFIAILALLVLVHEYGHFWTARKMGMGVEEFGFGFPPRAWSTVKNGIRYSINWLPLGGFVKIKGEDGSMREQTDSFGAKKPWQRILVLSAGVIMNFLLAGVLLSVGFMFGLPQALDGVNDANVKDVKVQVVSLLPDQPAAKAGIQVGDAIQSVDGTDIANVDQLISLVGEKVGQTAKVVVKRGEEVIEKDISIVQLESTGKGGIGVGLLATGIVSYAPHVAVYKGFESTVLLTGSMFKGFYDIIKNLVSGKGAGVDVSGPVGIAVMTGQIASLGWAYLLQFAAMLSVNLAVINFLPFPALDGGRVLFVLIEKLRGKPVNDKLEGVSHAIGFALLMLLIIIVTYKDIIRLFN